MKSRTTEHAVRTFGTRKQWQRDIAKNKKTNRRFVPISIPGNSDDEEIPHYVYDKKNCRTVEKCLSAEDALIKARKWENNDNS